MSGPIQRFLAEAYRNGGNHSDTGGTACGWRTPVGDGSQTPPRSWSARSIDGAPPSLDLIAAIGAILSGHNLLEEGSGGLYDTCEGLVGNGVEALLHIATTAGCFSSSPLTSI